MKPKKQLFNLRPPSLQYPHTPTSTPNSTPSPPPSPPHTVKQVWILLLVSQGHIFIYFIGTNRKFLKIEWVDRPVSPVSLS